MIKSGAVPTPPDPLVNGRPDEKLLWRRDYERRHRKLNAKYISIEVLARAIVPLMQLWLGKLVNANCRAHKS